MAKSQLLSVNSKYIQNNTFSIVHFRLCVTNFLRCKGISVLLRKIWRNNESVIRWDEMCNKRKDGSAKDSVVCWPVRKAAVAAARGGCTDELSGDAISWRRRGLRGRRSRSPGAAARARSRSAHAHYVTSESSLFGCFVCSLRQCTRERRPALAAALTRKNTVLPAAVAIAISSLIHRILVWHSQKQIKREYSVIFL